MTDTTDIRNRIATALPSERTADLLALLDTVDALRGENVRLNGVKVLLQLRAEDAEAEVTRLKSALEK